jgi:sugar phosphate isomerase/epimerase
MDIAINTYYLSKKLGFKNVVSKIKNAGFDSLFLNIDDDILDWHSLSKGIVPTDIILNNPPQVIYDYYKDQLDFIKEQGLNISQVHAPCSAMLITTDELISFITNVYKNCIGFCKLAGIKHIVIHGFCKENFDKAHTYEDIKAINLKMFSSLIPELEGSDVTVCLENIFYCKDNICYDGICADPYQAVEYIDTLNSLCKDKKHFGLCLDVGHLYLCRTEINYYLRILGDRVVNTHIHDNQAISDLHAIPYAGIINWKFILKALKKHGYTGDLCFETSGYFQKLPDYLIETYLDFNGKVANYFRDVLTDKVQLKD